jgi:hypothetical protein
MLFKEVNYKIKVPNSNLCLDNTNKIVIRCNFFDNACGYPKCSLSFNGLEKIAAGVKKSKECMELKY